jgi:F-type H+-transporting ATPase subunit a
LICSLGLIWLLAAGPAGAAPAAPQHDEKPSIVTADPPAEAGHGIAPNDEAQGEAAPPEAGHGGAGHDDGHGAPAGDVGSIVKGVMEHHLTDSGHIELPLVAFHMDRVRIPLPFFNGLYQATREGNPLINWMVKAEDGRAYLMLSKHLVFMGVAVLLLLVLMARARRTAGSASPRGAGNLIEVFILFIRDQVVLPNTGEEGRRYLPFFLTVFFFILTMNLLGLVPFGSSATGNLSVTAGLALCAFAMMQVAGMRAHGVWGHFKGLMPHGVPVFVAPILLPIEFLGLFTKPFALCVRLFANMMAGHAVIAAFMGLIVVPVLALTNVPVAVAIGLLELFVAFLQAFIFTMLTAIFTGAFIHQH